MAEYIEREAVNEVIWKLFPYKWYSPISTDSCVTISKDEVKSGVDRIPSADVAPVVRCKDCKWFADNNDGSWYGCWLFQTIQIIPEDAPKPDDFCSYGEPKMEGGAGNAGEEM